MTHGYGMAIGGWYMILAELSASTHVFATDWLGWGLSSRPHWELEGTEETEAFFIDSLERWVHFFFVLVHRPPARLCTLVHLGRKRL